MNTIRSNTAKLPAVVTRFFDAVNRFDFAAVDSFTADARVHDENRDHVGTDAIRAWIAETSQKYRPTFEVLRAEGRDSKITLSVRVSGDFPGSPIDLDYDFALRDGKISTLSIQ